MDLHPILGPTFTWITPALSEWAIKLPVILAVNMMLSIILWIGYTMATTHPPVPLEDFDIKSGLDEETNEENKEE